MSEFHDPDLRQQLGRLSGPYPDDNAAFAAWQRRVGQARRRRVMAWTTGAALSLVVGTVGVAALQNPARHSVVPGKSSETSAEFTVSVASTEPEATDPATTESSAPETSAPTTLAPDTTPVSVAEAETSVPEAEGDEGSGSQGSGGSTGHGGSPTSAAPNDPQATTQTFNSGGGSITVRQDGDRLTIVGTNPASGFRAKENTHSGRRVDVTFKSGDHEFEISVRLSDGVMKSSVSEDQNDAPQHDTVPDGDGDNNQGGGGGGGGGGGDNND
jgi:hypothetical protein